MRDFVASFGLLWLAIACFAGAVMVAHGLRAIAHALLILAESFADEGERDVSGDEWKRGRDA